jgi:hypothetical protein
MDTKINTAIRFFADHTRAFISGRTTLEEHAEIVEAAKLVQLRMPEVEARVGTVDEALLELWDDLTPEQRAHGVDEDDLHECGEQIDGRNMTKAEMIECLATVTREELGLYKLTEISETMATGIATVCQAAREVIGRTVEKGDCTTPDVVERLQGIVNSLHEAALEQPSGALDFLPPALLPTVRRVLGGTYVDLSKSAPMVLS